MYKVNIFSRGTVLYNQFFSSEWLFNKRVLYAYCSCSVCGLHCILIDKAENSSEVH